MRHDDIRRLRDVDGIWLRIKLWLSRPYLRATAPVISDFSDLSEHQRRDIGLPDPVRYLDWKTLRTQGPLPDFTR